MKIKIKKHSGTVCTISSPYPDEIGEHTDTWETTHCGNCGRNIEQAHYYKKWNYCPQCGEKIDWD